MPRSAATTLKAFRASTEPATVTVRGLLIAAIRQAINGVGDMLDRLGRGEHGGHAAGLVRQLLMGAAVIDDLDRRAQVENAGSFRRGDFTHAMAEHRLPGAGHRARSAAVMPRPECRRSRVGRRW